MSKKLDPEEKNRRKQERDRAYYLKHYDVNKQRYRTHALTWRKENPDKDKAINRRFRQKLREDAIDAYGGKCACCGLADTQFLSIDHIENNGAQHRRENKLGRGSAGTYSWLRKHKYPPGFQVLCYNCNLGKAHFGGVCPHQTRRNA